MTVFEFSCELWLPADRAQVFPFFADAGNLQEITPPWLDFRVLTPGVTLAAGARIDHRLKVHGVPLRWRTRINEWEPPGRFVDEQLKGPYRLWWHEHVFEESRGGTLCRDRVRYAMWGGRLANALFVRRDVGRIFAFRRQRLIERFGAGPEGEGNPSVSPNHRGQSNRQKP